MSRRLFRQYRRRVAALTEENVLAREIILEMLDRDKLPPIKQLKPKVDAFRKMVERNDADV
jgi:hypothetical protein